MYCVTFTLLLNNTADSNAWWLLLYAKWKEMIIDQTVLRRSVLRLTCCEGWMDRQTLDTGLPCSRTRARKNHVSWCRWNLSDLSLSSSVHQTTVQSTRSMYTQSEYSQTDILFGYYWSLWFLRRVSTCNRAIETADGLALFWDAGVGDILRWWPKYCRLYYFHFSTTLNLVLETYFCNFRYLEIQVAQLSQRDRAAG